MLDLTHTRACDTQEGGSCDCGVQDRLFEIAEAFPKALDHLRALMRPPGVTNPPSERQKALDEAQAFVEAHKAL